MSKQTDNLALELTRDKWGSDMAPLDQVPDYANSVFQAITEPEVREWIQASPLSPVDYRQLRWLLQVLRRSKVVKPRRLTWRERITGRVQQ
jgi:hypothetical protein